MYLLYVQKTETVSSVLPRKEKKMLLFILCAMISQTRYKPPGSTKTSVDVAVKMVYSFSYFLQRPCSYEENCKDRYLQSRAAPTEINTT